MLIRELYQQAIEQLAKAGVAEPQIDASLLLGHVLDLSRAQLILEAERHVVQDDEKQFAKLLARRLKREPVAYILGEQEFWSLAFTLTPDVLIPRPETELLLEHALRCVDKMSNINALDLGVGSGAITVVLAKELPRATVYGIDRSAKALAVARQNAHRHWVAQRVHLMQGDWLSSLSPEQYFDLIVSNPPYVLPHTFAELEPEVRDFEPHLALDGGADGLKDIRVLAENVHRHLLAGGWFFMEIGFDQEEAVLNIFATYPEYDSLAVHPDLAGLPRIFQAQRRK